MSEAAPDATQRDTRGTLYLIPVALGEATPWSAFLPTQAQAVAAGLRRFVVETGRAARAHGPARPARPPVRAAPQGRPRRGCRP